MLSVWDWLYQPSAKKTKFIFKFCDTADRALKWNCLDLHGKNEDCGGKGIILSFVTLQHFQDLPGSPEELARAADNARFSVWLLFSGISRLLNPVVFLTWLHDPLLSTLQINVCIITALLINIILGKLILFTEEHCAKVLPYLIPLNAAPYTGWGCHQERFSCVHPESRIMLALAQHLGCCQICHGFTRVPKATEFQPSAAERTLVVTADAVMPLQRIGFPVCKVNLHFLRDYQNVILEWTNQAKFLKDLLL